MRGVLLAGYAWMWYILLIGASWLDGGDSLIFCAPWFDRRSFGFSHAICQFAEAFCSIRYTRF